MKILILTLLVIIAITLSACQPGQVTPTPTVFIPTIELPTPEPTDLPGPLEIQPEPIQPLVPPDELAKFFGLPEGYLAGRVAAPVAADVFAIARSQTGRIYLQRGGLFPGISLLDDTTGEITDILSTAGLEVGTILNGPGDSILMRTGRELWRLNPDGSHEVWSQVVTGEPLFFTQDGSVYSASADGQSVLKSAPGVSVVEVAGGFLSVSDLIAMPDETLFVVDGQTADLVRVDPDGRPLLLDGSLPEGEQSFIGLDAAGNLYRNSPSGGFDRVDTQSGKLDPFPSIYSPCSAHPSDFVISENGMVIFVDPLASQVTWGDLATSNTGVLASNEGFNSAAVDVGPDGALYVGASSCGGAMPSQVVRIGRDGDRSVAYDNISGRITALAYDLRGGIYLASASQAAGSRLLYYPAPGQQPFLLDTSNDYEVLSLDVDPNSGDAFATLSTSARILEFDWQGLVDRHYAILPREHQEYDLAITGDGQIYAYVSEKGRYQSGPTVDRYLLKLIFAEAKGELVDSFPWKGCCPSGSLVAEPDGSLWLLRMPEGLLWRYPQEGDAVQFAGNLPAGTAGLAVNLYGDVFLSGAGGIYRFYRSGGP